MASRRVEGRNSCKFFYTVVCITLEYQLLMQIEFAQSCVVICNRFNLSQLEDWVRLNQLEGSGIVEALENVIQATQLLQVNKKTLEDVDAICEVCSSLNTLQVRLV